MTSAPVAGALPAAVVRDRRRAKRKAAWRRRGLVLLLMSPWLVGFTVFFAYPLRQFVMRSNVKGFDPSPLHQTYELFGAVKE